MIAILWRFCDDSWSDSDVDSDTPESPDSAESTLFDDSDDSA